MASRPLRGVTKKSAAHIQTQWEAEKLGIHLHFCNIFPSAFFSCHSRLDSVYTVSGTEISPDGGKNYVFGPWGEDSRANGPATLCIATHAKENGFGKPSIEGPSMEVSSSVWPVICGKLSD